MFQEFPYSDMHQLNLDWIIKIAKDFLDQYTHIQQLITDGEASLQNLTEDGLTQLQNKATELEGLLQQWYNTHSSDIANQLATALNDLNSWYTTHMNYLDTTLVNKTAEFAAIADAKAAEAIGTIPADYSALTNALYYGTGFDESVTYADWNSLTSGIPTNLCIGASKLYPPGFLYSVKMKGATANTAGTLYVVEVEEHTNKILQYTTIEFTYGGGIYYIPVSKLFTHSFYVYIKAGSLCWKALTSTYKTGEFVPGTTTTATFPDNLQLAVGVVMARSGSQMVNDNNKLTDAYNAIDTEIVEKTYHNWDILTTGSTGTWGTNKQFAPGFIKAVRLKVRTSATNKNVYIIPVKRDNTITNFKNYTFDAVAGIQDVPINEYISYPFYVFTDASVAYYTNPGDGVYMSGTYNASAAGSAFDASFQFAFAVIRKPANAVNEYWNYSDNIPVLGMSSRNIILLGDSIVQGYGISDYATCEKVEFPIAPSLEQYTSLSHEQLISNNHWGMKLKNYIESTYSYATVTNYGIGGLQTAQLLMGYLEYIDSSTTDVIISIGTNDTSAADKRHAITNPLITIINDLKSKKINVIILTNTIQVNNGTMFNNVQQAIIDACNATGITPVNIKNEMEYYCYMKNISLTSLMADALHPNNAGYDVIYNIIKRWLKL